MYNNHELCFARTHHANGHLEFAVINSKHGKLRILRCLCWSPI